MSRMSSHSERRPARRPLVLAAVVCALVAATGVSAQQTKVDDQEPTNSGFSDPNVPFSRSGGHRVVVGGESGSGTATAFPNNGRAGAELKLATSSLPFQVSAQINFGALREGFEVISTGYVDRGGRFNGRDTMTVTIPDWAKNDRPYLLIVSDLQYVPLAPAEMVHPTDAQGMIRRHGIVKQEVQGGCPTLTGEVGELYFLTGNTRGINSGHDMRVHGRVLQNTRCGAGTTIEVLSATPAH